jgi:hypothetical protein
MDREGLARAVLGPQAGEGAVQPYRPGATP